MVRSRRKMRRKEDSMESCPECFNEKILEVGGKEISYTQSVSTGKIIKKDKIGTTIWWMFTCKCGWKSEVFTE